MSEDAKEDWRLSGKDHPAWKWFHGATIRRAVFTEADAGTDHVHCEFCWETFMERDDSDQPQMLHVGYKTDDGPCWICEECFRDFAPRFGWIVE